MPGEYRQRRESRASASRRIPEPETGINRVEIKEDIPIFQLILGENMSESSTKAVWIDSGNNSSTYALSSAGSQELLHRVKIGRAFTAFQHYHIVNRIEEFLDEDTEYIVLPNIDQQYIEGNVSEKEVEDLFSEVLNKLESLKTERPDLKILYSVVSTGPNPINLELKNITDNRIRIEKTDQGLREKSNTDQQLFYRKNGFMQTTIPYWRKKNHRKPQNTVKVDYNGENERYV
ncbi:MAG: hypothetical protein ABEK10_04180 [Candidatus Nanosalina sp.]